MAMIRKSSFLPVRRVIDLLRSTSSARLIPSGVISNAQARINATGNPITSSNTTNRTAQFGISKKWKDLGGDLDKQPGDDSIRDGNFLNVAAIQFAEDSRRVNALFICG